MNRKKIVILGGGFGGIYVLKDLHRLMHKERIADLQMISEKNYFLFTPLLHEVATGGLNPASTVEPIRKFLGCCLNAFRLGTAERIRTHDRIVDVGGALIPYDYLVIATGATTNFYNIPGAAEHTLPLKSVEDAIRIKKRILRALERASETTDAAERKKLLTFIVSGGGPTGVELVTEIEELINETCSHYYPREIRESISIIIVQRDRELVPQLNPKIRQKSLDVLQKKGVHVRLMSSIVEAGKGYVMLHDGTKLEAGTVIWVAGIQPRIPEFDVQIERAPDGRILVNEYFQVKGHGGIFALGDVAAFESNGAFLPALAQVAEKEAHALAKNLARMLREEEPEKFAYRHSGSLLSLGQWMAAGDIKGFTFYGRFAWWIWRTIYLFKFISFRKKVRVAIDWTINLFSPRDISEV